MCKIWLEPEVEVADKGELIDKQIAYEIKSGKTFSADYLKGLRYWAKISSATAEQCNVIYCGDIPMKMSDCNLLTLNDI